MKPASVTNILVFPPPTVKSVPEAQPPPSCIPMPKRKAPMTTAVPNGLTLPRIVSVNSGVPDASTGKNRAQVMASNNICPRSPAPRRSLMNTRQDDVKPNAA